METFHFDCISYVRAEGIYTLDFCPVWTIPDKISTEKELPLSVRHVTQHRSDHLSERDNAVMHCTCSKCKYIQLTSSNYQNEE